MLTGPIPRRISRPVRGLRIFRRSQGPSSRMSPSSMVGNGHSEASDHLRKSITAMITGSLPCLDIAPRTAGPTDGLTTMLSIDARHRDDVLDLDRAFFMNNGGTADVSWLSLPPASANEPFQLLLSVSVTAPTRCDFAVQISVAGDDRATASALSYLLAADLLALGFDVPVTAGSAIILRAPTDRRALVAALRAVAH